MSLSKFKECEVCGSSDWVDAYRGDIRDGAFGAICKDAVVAACASCGVQRLGEKWCIPDSYYETGEYRTHLKQELDTNSYFDKHDWMQKFALQTIPLEDLRGKTIADIGCAGGSFLDHVHGIVNKAYAIEPCREFHQGLKDRNYGVFPLPEQVSAEVHGTLDFAFSYQVIEHTADPKAFLQNIRPLLKPDGLLYISTPNLRDVLMNLLGDDYRAFFYRVVHRWYFDADSLAQCARRAGFKVAETHFVHRYNMANAMRWLRDKKPTGNVAEPPLDAMADQLWKIWTENAGVSDCLFMALEPDPDFDPRRSVAAND